MSEKQEKIGKHSASALKSQRAQNSSSVARRQVKSNSPATTDVSNQRTVSMPPVGKRSKRDDKVFESAAAKDSFSQDETVAFGAVGAPAAYAAEPATTSSGMPMGGFNAAAPGAPMDGYAGWTAAGQEGEKKVHDKKKVGIVVGSIVGVILAIYLIGVFVFSGHFYPNSTLGGTDVSMKSASEVATLAESKGSSYSVAVSGDGMNFTITSEEAGLDVNGSTVASSALAANNAFLWPYELTQKHDETPYLVAEYNSNGLSTIVKQKVEAFNATATAPTNATIAYSDATGTFAVQAEKAGTQLDESSVLATIDDAVANMDTAATLTSANLVQPTVLSDDARLAAAVTKANGYIKADLKLVMGDSGVQATEINAKQISQWVTLDSSMNVAFNTDAMNTWLGQLCDSLNTVGSTRTYTRPDGKTFTVTGGTYGWEIDGDSLVQQVSDGITAGTTATITVPTVTEGYTYKAAGAQDWGIYVDVDLTEQHARCYDTAGNLLWESDVITGKPDGEHNTPEGVWTLYNKESPSVLKGSILASTGAPEYETQVSYWMAFTYSGCGLHDATWQSAFGGTRYADGYGSHGCVNLPLSAAASLYNIISVGNAVVVHS